MPQPGPTPGTTILTPEEAEAGGYTMGPYGFYLEPGGSVAPGQVTQGQRDNPGATNYYDPAKGGLRYNIRDGQRVYQSDGKTSEDPGGGAFHGVPQWNQKTGEFDVGLDWGKILSYAAGAGIGASYIIPALAGGGAGTAPVAGGTLPSTTTVGSSTLGGGMVPGASGGIAAAPSGLVPAAGAGGIIPTASTVATLPSTATVSHVGSLPTATPSWSATPGGGGNVGWFDTAKKLYKGYEKYKGYADEGQDLYNEARGNPPQGGANPQGNRTVQDMNDAVTGAEYGRATAREREAAIQQQQDRINLQRSQLEQQQAQARNAFTLDSANTDLSQRNFGLAAPGKRASNAVRGDILSRAQDVSFGNLGPNMHVPTISGGLRPSMFSDATRELGTNMTNQAFAGQQAGDTFAPLTYQAPAPVPELTPLPQAGAVDKILNTAGTVTTGLDIFQKWLNNRKQKPPAAQAPQNDATADPYLFSGPTQDDDPSKVRGLA